MKKQNTERIFSGKKIQHYRLKKKLTRPELSEAANIPVVTLEAWEYEKTHPSKISSILNLIEVLDCTLQDLCADGVVLDKSYKKQLRKKLTAEESDFLLTLLHNKEINNDTTPEEQSIIKSIVGKLT